MDYFKREGLSQSQLKDFAVSPALYKLRQQEPRIETEAMMIGSAVHAAILEPEIFNKKYMMGKKFDRRKKAGREQFTLFVAENSDKIFLTEEQYDSISKMRDSVYDHPKARDVLSLKMEAEKEIFFEMDGVACKAKLDAVVPEIKAVIDFKTARTSSAESFKRDMVNLGYDLQAYWYYEAYKAAYGSYPAYYAFIVVSKEEPYPVGFFEVDTQFLDRGRYYAQKYLAKYKECVASNIWPKNESEDVIRINTPDWAIREVMEFGEAYFSTMNREF